jgi:hypothetical protein
MHIDEAVLTPLRELYGEPVKLGWKGEISEREYSLATQDGELAPRDTEEIQAACWGTLPELAGPLRERLLVTGRAFWRYRVALHVAAAAALAQ